jgi:DNA-binding CsgD family transcriptional regulator
MQRSVGFCKSASLRFLSAGGLDSGFNPEERLPARGTANGERFQAGVTLLDSGGVRRVLQAMTTKKETALAPVLEDALEALGQVTDLVSAANALRDIGLAIGQFLPAVVEDFSSERLLTMEDGRLLAIALGWEETLPRLWSEQKLHLLPAISALCRENTRPFVWNAEDALRMIPASRARQSVDCPFTPLHGIHGGITVPVHLPFARTGSVNWMSQTPEVDLDDVLVEHGTTLRLASYLFMDIVYASRGARNPAPQSGSSLNERELECLSWAAFGRTDVEIGALIHRSPATARFHIDNAIGKLGARNRTQAVAIAAQLGLVTQPDDDLDESQNSQFR